MKAYLLDTNVLSEVLRRRPEPAVVDRLRALEPTSLHTSSVCVFELRLGAMRRTTGGLELWRRIAEEVLSRLRVVPFGDEEARRAGDLMAELAGRGEPIGLEDVQIAATARVRGFTVVTRNVRHFGRVDGLRVENWWS